MEGLRDGSGSANLFRSITHGLGSRMRNCRQPALMNSAAGIWIMKGGGGPNHGRIASLACCVAKSSHLQTIARVFLSSVGTRIIGSGLLRELQLLKKIAFGGVYVTDPVVPTFSEPKLTLWIQECVTVNNWHTKIQSYNNQMRIAR